jgi:hypothetical protein
MVFAPFLKKAGQIWKFVFGFGLMLCGTAAVYGTLHNWWGPLNDGVSMSIDYAGCALALASFGWMNWSIRCPECHAKLLWRAVSQKPHPAGLQSLWILERCPTARRSQGSSTNHWM